MAVNLRLTWPAPAWQFVRRPWRWPIATAGAAGAAGEPPPNPCKTFTAPAAHRLFKVSGSTKLRETSRSFGHGSNQIRTCTIKHARHVLVVNVARFSEDFGAPVKCFNRPKLGKHGVGPNVGSVGRYAVRGRYLVPMRDDRLIVGGSV